jgi:hypothetical protein
MSLVGAPLVGEAAVARSARARDRCQTWRRRFPRLLTPLAREPRREPQSFMVVEELAKLPVVPVPSGVAFQPVDSDEVAARLVELALGRPTDIGSCCRSGCREGRLVRYGPVRISLPSMPSVQGRGSST